MNFRKKMTQENAGFTLVELIVVIAIIAILAVVSVVGYTRYMEDARFSNDTQAASQMTTVLNSMVAANDIEYDELDSHGVRDLLKESGETFTMSPTSKNAGFFYVSESKSIVVMKYNTAVELESNASFTKFNSPEELFGVGLFLLTVNEIPVPFASSFVRNMADSGNNVKKEYDSVLKAIDKYEGNIFAQLSNQKLEGAVKTRVVNMLKYYSPETTLFVNNTAWVTSATDPSQITKVLFSPGISNLPTFSSGLEEGKTQVSSITLPGTVKTAEHKAFPAVYFKITNVSYSSSVQIIGGSNPFEGMIGVPMSLISSTRLSLVNYRGYIDMSNIKSGENSPGTLSIDLTEITKKLVEDGVDVESVRLVLNHSNPSLSKVYIYTSKGLYAVATPALVPNN